MSEKQEHTIVFETTPSKEGTYQRQDEDGGTIAGDASGEWRLDENGEVEDIVFFISPGAIRRRAK